MTVTKRPLAKHQVRLILAPMMEYIVSGGDKPYIKSRFADQYVPRLTIDDIEQYMLDLVVGIDKVLIEQHGIDLAEEMIENIDLSEFEISTSEVGVANNPSAGSDLLAEHMDGPTVPLLEDVTDAEPVSEHPAVDLSNVVKETFVPGGPASNKVGAPNMFNVLLGLGGTPTPPTVPPGRSESSESDG